MRGAVDCFNDFYGITIFLQLAATVFAVLGWLSQVTLAYLPIDVYTCVIPPKAICSIVIIFCCDSVLEEAEKSIFISLALSERLPWKSQKRTAVFSLIQTCKDYAPQFLVLGLFCIKRSTVLGLFNIVSTLMIVFVQSTKIE
nr:unnamed protein product [Callosobruchus chinensis]